MSLLNTDSAPYAGDRGSQQGSHCFPGAPFVVEGTAVSKQISNLMISDSAQSYAENRAGDKK